MSTNSPLSPVTADVIVVGAGAAGIEAARTVSAAGRTVIVLEARDRIGGRLHTDHTSMSVPIERGAELIHGATVSTWDTIRAKKIDTHLMSARSARRSPTDPWYDPEGVEASAFPLGVPDLPDPLPHPGSSETAEGYLHRLGITSDNVPLALKVIEVDSEQFSKLPAVEIMEELQDLVRSASSDQRDNISAESDFRVVGGYDQVLTARAASLTIRTGTVVTKVLADASDVEVVTGKGTFTAQAVIVTVPAGVLQAESIVFDPPIPGDQAAAIAEVEYLPVFKGIMEFSEPVLPAGQDLVEDYSLQVPSFWNASAEITGYSGQVVVGWATGDNARRLRSLSEAAQRDTLTDALRVLTGNADIEPIAFVHHDWETDPFSRGSYPRHGIESALLYRPIAGRVFWAGMITDTIHHSADTGRSAAHSALHTLR